MEALRFWFCKAISHAPEASQLNQCSPAFLAFARPFLGAPLFVKNSRSPTVILHEGLLFSCRLRQVRRFRLESNRSRTGVGLSDRADAPPGRLAL